MALFALVAGSIGIYEVVARSTKVRISATRRVQTATWHSARIAPGDCFAACPKPRGRVRGPRLEMSCLAICGALAPLALARARSRRGYARDRCAQLGGP